MNLLLGIPAIVPLFLVWYFMVNGPLAYLGWTQRDPNENDGMLPMVLFIVPIVSLCGLIWWLINTWMRRKMAVSAPHYWFLCATATVLPFCIIPS